jgi:hypothetical protein
MISNIEDRIQEIIIIHESCQILFDRFLFSGSRSYISEQRLLLWIPHGRSPWA